MKKIGEDVVEWLVNEMLEYEIFMKRFFESKIGRTPNTKPNNYFQTVVVSYAKKNLKLKTKKKNQM